MADWKTYAKAARNTARKQAPDARDAARRASGRAGGYVRAAGRAIDQGGRDDDAPRRRDENADGARRAESAPRAGSTRSTAPRSGTQRPVLDGDRMRKDAAAYYTVASRRVAKANVVPRIMRALRDALLIGLSLVAIWAVLAAAGIPVPFSTVLIIVAVIVAVSFAVGLYAQWKRSQVALDDAEDPRDR